MQSVQSDHDALFYPDPLEPGQLVHVLSIVNNDVLVDFPGTVDDPVVVHLNQLKPLPDGDLPAVDSPLPSEGEGLGVRGDFGEGQRITYTPALPPIRALPATVTAVHDNGKLSIRVDDTKDIPAEYRGGSRTVRASRCAPLTAAVDPQIVNAVYNSPAEPDAEHSPRPVNGEGQGEGSEPRPVDSAHVAITGVCRDCGSQYDYVFEPADLQSNADLVYWAAFSQCCPVCRRINAAQVVVTEYTDISSDDTEPLLALPPDETTPADPPIVNGVHNLDGESFEAIDADLANGATPPDWFEPPLETPADPFDLTSLTEPVNEAGLITDLRDLVAHWQRAAELESARADRLQDKVDDYLILHIELLKRIPVAPGAALDNADLDRLDFLTVKHLECDLHDAVQHLGFRTLDDFIGHYHSFNEAYRGIYQRIVDGGLPVTIHDGATDISSNDKFFFTMSFGFGAVNFFNGDINLLGQTPHKRVLDEWRTSGYSVAFDPPIRAILGRDHKQYPKIKTLLED